MSTQLDPKLIEEHYKEYCLRRQELTYVFYQSQIQRDASILTLSGGGLILSATLNSGTFGLDTHKQVGKNTQITACVF